MKLSAFEIVLEKKENQLNEWWNLYGNNLFDLERYLSECLLSGIIEDKDIVVSFFRNSELLQHYIHTENIAIMSIFISAYEVETKVGIKENILDRKMTITDYVQLYNEIKFYLWHLEFAWENSENELRDYIYHKKLSWYLLQFLIYAVAFDKDLIMDKVLTIYKGNQL